MSGAVFGVTAASEYPVPHETGRTGATEALRCGGACFQPDRVPGCSQVLRLRTQPIAAAPALRTGACCFELELVAFVTPGP